MLAQLKESSREGTVCTKNLKFVWKDVKNFKSQKGQPDKTKRGIEKTSSTSGAKEGGPSLEKHSHQKEDER